MHSYIYRPKENHPTFYGCFDWHSSVHGHWLLATVARRYPNTELADNVTAVFKEQFRVNLSIKTSLEIILLNLMYVLVCMVYAENLFHRYF